MLCGYKKVLQRNQDSSIRRRDCTQNLYSQDPNEQFRKRFFIRIRMLSNRETSAAELNLAKSAILGGQVSPDLPTQFWADYSALSGAYSSQE